MTTLPVLSDSRGSSGHRRIPTSGGGGNYKTDAIHVSTSSSAAMLVDPSSFHEAQSATYRQQHKQSGVPVQAAPSKLSAEVDRLISRGQALILREGSEAEGVAYLGKALWARSRFPALQRGDGVDRQSTWEHGEAFVVTCNQLAMRLVQSLQPGAQVSANEIMRSAEDALTDEEVDCFAGFQPLRQHLLGATLNNIATLQRLNSEPSGAVVITLERALRIEGGRMSTLTLLNLASAYVSARRYDEACTAVTSCIVLANQYLSLPVVNPDSEAWIAFSHLIATHATLAHLLISVLASWTTMDNVAVHHARLALACAHMHLGSTSALTTRCQERLARLQNSLSAAAAKPSSTRQNTSATFSVEASAALTAGGSVALGGLERVLSEANLNSASSFTTSDEPPLIPLQAATMSSRRLPPSQVLPFALAVPLPPSVADFALSIMQKRDVLRSGFLPALAVGTATGSKQSLQQPPPLPQSTLSDKVTRTAGAQTPTKAKRNESQNNNNNRMWTPQGKGKQQQQLRVPPLGPSHAFMSTSITSLKTTQQVATSSTRSAEVASNSPVDDGTVSSCASVALIPKPPGSRASSGRATGGRALASVDADVEMPQQSREAVVSVLPKAQLLAYQRITDDVQQLVLNEQLLRGRSSSQRFGATLGGAQLSPLSDAAASLYSGVKQQTSSTVPTGPRVHSPMYLDDVAPQRVADVIRISDMRLRELSILCPDHTDEDEVRWNACAREIQRVYRGHRVRSRVAAPLRRVLRDMLFLVPFAERLQRWWLDRVACRPAIAERGRRRRQRQLGLCATVLQAAGRHVLSQIELRSRWLAERHRRQDELRRVMIQAAAAVFLQAWMRGLWARKRYRTMQRSARTIQRSFLLFKLYQQVRVIVFRNRIKRREFCALLFSKASRIQRWWHHMLPKRRSKQELQRRQQALRSHLEDFLQRDRSYWEKVAHLDDDACRHIVQRWSVGYHERKRLFLLRERIRRESRAAGVLQRWYRFSHSRTLLNRRIEQRREMLQLQKRAEEVHEACIDIQRIARSMLAKQRVRTVRDALAKRHNAARRIQFLARRCIRRRELHERAQQRQTQVQRYLLAQQRLYAATKIQATWRMFATTKFVEHLRKFLTVDRHCYARRIQRLARTFLCERRCAERRCAQLRTMRTREVAELRFVAARKIQSHVRMMLCRRQLRQRQDDQRAVLVLGSQVDAPTCVRRRLLFPTRYQRSTAAVAIQSCWRRVAAFLYTQQLRQARCYLQASRIAQEHLHVYATVIQCAVRKFILTPLRVAAAKQQQSSRAAVRIQRAAKAYLDRKRVMAVLLEQEEREVLSFIREEHYFAAMRIQKQVKGYLTKIWFQAVRHAVVQMQRVARGFLGRSRSRRLRMAREQRYEEAVGAEERDAAVTIQRAWRHTR